MATAQSPVSVIERLDDACNAHDLESVMSLFSDDAEVRQTPPPDGAGVYRGKEQIRRWFEPQLPGFHVDDHEFESTGDSVRWSAKVSMDLLKQIGQEGPVGARNEATVRGGKIVSFIVTNPSLMGNA